MVKRKRISGYSPDFRIVEAERAAREQERLAAERQRQAEVVRNGVQERARVAERFKEIATMREVRAFGYGDQSDNWRATPEALRKAVDDFNAAPQQTRDRFIESLQREPNKARAIDTLMEQRERSINRDRDGPGL